MSESSRNADFSAKNVLVLLLGSYDTFTFLEAPVQVEGQQSNRKCRRGTSRVSPHMWLLCRNKVPAGPVDCGQGRRCILPFGL